MTESKSAKWEFRGGVLEAFSGLVDSGFRVSGDAANDDQVDLESSDVILRITRDPNGYDINLSVRLKSDPDSLVTLDEISSIYPASKLALLVPLNKEELWRDLARLSAAVQMWDAGVLEGNVHTFERLLDRIRVLRAKNTADYS